MIRLIKAEFKKIFKSKANSILLLVLMILSGYNCYQIYHTGPSKHLPVENYINTDGDISEGLDYWKEADKVQRLYTGTLNDSIIKKMHQDFMKIIDTYSTDKVDHAYMLKVYGDNYEEKIEKAKTEGYTTEEFDKIFPNYISIYKGYWAQPIEGTDKLKFGGLDIFMEGDATTSLYSSIYNVYRYNENPDEITYHTASFEELSRWLHASDLTKQQLRKEFLGEAPISSKTEATIEPLLDRFQKAPHDIGSNIGNNLYLKSMYELDIFSLLVIILIVSNIFAIEKQHKTDQIMSPSFHGARNIAIAKLITGVLFAIGIVALQISIITLMSIIFLPMSDVGFTVYAQSQFFFPNGLTEFLFTYKEMIFNGILLIMISAIATACITMLISYISKNRFVTVIPLLLIFILTGYILIFDSILPGTILDLFFPAQMVHFTRFFHLTFYPGQAQFLPYFTMFGQTFAWKDAIMLFWVLMSLGMSMFVVMHSRKHNVKTY
ncbi:MAG: ABC transporter permease [Longicatena sp.]